MIFMLDNYDSFTYNLVQYYRQLGEEVVVKRNDEVSIAQIAEINPDYIVISPGPGTPQQAGVSIEAILSFAGKIPVFGVCLGLQSIGEAFGGRIVSAKTIMHGKLSQVNHKSVGAFSQINNPVTCTRYHSLVVEKSSLPDCLEVTAWTDDDEIMGLRHKTLAIEGVQFHPEALLTDQGLAILNNFLVEHRRKI